jgi:GNAT superfamily N-acetyltransferase
MDFINTTVLSDKQKKRLLDLWNDEYPANLRHSGVSELEEYLANLSDVAHILLVENGQILGWYFDFNRAAERWFAMILDRAIQGRGWGSKILEVAKEKNSLLNGWVIDHDDNKMRDGSAYKSPLGFYLKNGFDLMAEQRLELDKISAVRIKWKK